MTDLKITEQQEAFVCALRRAHKDIRVTDVDMWAGGTVCIQFEFTDPRPSRNGLVDHGYFGFVAVGKRGGFKGAYFTPKEIFAKAVKCKDFWMLLNRINRSGESQRRWISNPHSN
jgi:hypothetical protein